MNMWVKNLILSLVWLFFIGIGIVLMVIVPSIDDPSYSLYLNLSYVSLSIGGLISATQLISNIVWFIFIKDN